MRLSTCRTAACATLLAALVSFGTGASAGVASTSANVDIIAPPPSVVVGALESNDRVKLFNEKSSHALSAPLFVDVTQTGSAITPGNIATGTVVDSWFLHADPVGGSVRTYQGFVTFDTPVLGIILRDGSLDLSDAELGAAGTTYPFQVAYRGYEFNGNDLFALSADRLTVRFTAVTSTVVDQMRIVTEAAPVPEPGSMILAGVGLSSIAGLRRRRTR